LLKVCSADYLLGRTNDKSVYTEKIINKIQKLQAELDEIANDIKKL